MYNRFVVFILFSIGAINPAQGQELPEGKSTMLALEVDPAPFVLGGYSFSLKYGPASLKQWAFMGSIYSSDFPDKMMRSENYDAGFRKLELRTSYAVFVDYFLKDERKGWHAGPALFYYSKAVSHPSVAGTIAFTSLYPNVRFGYLFKPWQHLGFYFNPWVNIGKEFGLKGSREADGAVFELGNLSYIMALHLGYRYSF